MNTGNLTLDKVVTLMEARGWNKDRISRFVSNYVSRRYPAPEDVSDIFDVQQILHHERGFAPYITFLGAA